MAFISTKGALKSLAVGIFAGAMTYGVTQGLSSLGDYDERMQRKSDNASALFTTLAFLGVGGYSLKKARSKENSPATPSID